VVNTESCENSLSLSPDEHHLFFARPRAAGPADVWVSYRSDVGKDFGWQPPVLLGAAINTDAAAESTPRLFERTRLGLWQLYFYRDPGAIGSFDIYVADAFGIAQPVTELNSPSIEAGPALARDGLEILVHQRQHVVQRLPAPLAPRDQPLRDSFALPVPGQSSSALKRRHYTW
jgi:hypothetical protein